MSEQTQNPAAEVLSAMSKLEVPLEVRNLIGESVAKAREASEKWAAAATNYAAIVEDGVKIGQESARIVGARILANAAQNIEAAFETAQSLARARTVADVAQIQMKFAQDQWLAAGQQSKALFELSEKIARETTDAMTAMATKGLEEFKKSR